MKNKLFLALIFALCAFGTWAQDMGTGKDGPAALEIVRIKKELWYNVYLHDQRLGYYYIQESEARWQDRNVISRYMELYIKVKRFSQELETRIIIIDILSEDLRPLAAFEYDYSPFSALVAMEGIVDKKQLKVKIVTGDKIEEKILSIPADFTSDLAVTMDMLKAGFKPGWKKKYSLFNSESLLIEENTTEVLGQKQVDFLGESRVINEVRTVKNTGSLITQMIEWYDDQGDSLVSQEKTTGIKLERTTKQAALSGGEGMDLKTFSIVPKNKIKDPEKVSYLKLQLSSDQEQALQQFVEDDRQHALKQGDEYFLEVWSKPFSDDLSLTLPLAARYKDERYLKAGNLIQADDKDIVELAARIVGDEKNAWKACKKITYWLKYNIKPSYRMAFLSAKEVLEKKEGDCTEFAVLFAALARASGISTKVNVGLVYAEGQFYYHAWNEVFVGSWVPIDAALGQNLVDATHLKIYSGDLSSTNDPFVKTIQVMGRLQIEVVTYNTDGN